MIGYAQHISHINEDDNQTIHEDNNKTITELLNTFVEANEISKSDFIVVGSACASYMDYIILNKVRDVDIYIPDKSLTVNKTDRIDIINLFAGRDCFMENIVEKDGFLFVDKKDLLLSMTVSYIYKYKRSDASYIRLLLADLDMTISDYIEFIQTELPKASNITQDRKDIVLERLELFAYQFSDCDLNKEKENINYYKQI